VLLAKEIATLDQDSGGRLSIGIGIGWQREELEIMGGNWEHRASQTRESVEVMKKLWTGEFVEHHGEFYDFPSMLSSPTPLQRPHPPVLLGMHTERTPSRVAAYADGWLESVTDLGQLHGLGIEHIADCRSRLDVACRDKGRDPETVSLSVILNDGDGTIDRALIDRYLAVGAARIVLLGSRREDQPFPSDRDALDWLNRLADRVLDAA
jgi:alkanesulfonate monooxygenase SsuD/methylene tetrahydromethanopterin reductase-like flavin-dependent oxidoreductase (luciferase family)